MDCWFDSRDFSSFFLLFVFTFHSYSPIRTVTDRDLVSLMFMDENLMLCCASADIPMRTPAGFNQFSKDLQRISA